MHMCLAIYNASVSDLLASQTRLLCLLDACTLLLHGSSSYLAVCKLSVYQTSHFNTGAVDDAPAAI